jgi:UDP-N-acetylglucosamine 1-carboxyvinyltransferase
MDKLEITGPCRLAGRVDVSGAKNAALPALAATVLTDEPVRLRHLPEVADIRTLGKVLGHLGVAIETSAAGERTLCARDLSADDAPYELVKTMRASILVLGPLVARRGHARVSMPGGCAIGPRPVDLHIAALKAMGAEIDVEHGDIVARAPRGLRGAVVYFPQVTVTGTENILMAAVLAKGTTEIRNAAEEPEIVDLVILLRAMGGRIEGEGTRTLRIEGVPRLGGAGHDILPDRIEAGTWIVAAALAGERVEIDALRPADLEAFLAALRSAGVPMEVAGDRIVVSRAEALAPRDVSTAPHPGFPTDLQAQYMTLMTQAGGRSRITETIFENRFQHALELDRMGADIRIEHQTAVVNGPSRLSGARVMASDLRASAALVLAALVADGTTTVDRIYHLDRGYAAMETKLRALGATVTRVK